MVNNVTLLGRITRDPEVKAVGEGSAVCNFSLAVNRNFKNQQGEYEADFINVVAFGNTAQRMQQYVTKGNLLAITGRIQTRNYENNTGQRVYVTEVVANNVSFVETKGKNENPYSGAPEAQAQAAQPATEVPAAPVAEAPAAPATEVPAAPVAEAPAATEAAPIEQSVNDFSNISDDDMPF